MTRQRSGAARQSDSRCSAPPTSADVGRVLRQARQQQGLDLLDVHDRLERPITQLEALEAGDLAGLPDQAFALSTLRRYAALLSLDGDALAVCLIEAWTAPPAKPVRRPRLRADGGAGVVTEVTSQPDHLLAFTQTGQVPGMGSAGARSAAAPAPNGHGTLPEAGGVAHPAYHSTDDDERALAGSRRRPRAPALLRTATWFTALLVVAVAAGLVVQHRRPQLLVDWHITPIAHPGTGNGRTVHPAGGGTVHPAPDPVRLSSASAAAETYTVSTSDFTVAIATSAPCWVQVNNPSSGGPVAQLQQKGQVEHYRAKGSLTLEVGSSAALIGVTINGKNVFVTGPRNAPFTYTFVSSASAASAGSSA